MHTVHKNVAVELTGYEYIDVLTRTNYIIKIIIIFVETIRTSADEATGGVGTVSILVT